MDPIPLRHICLVHSVKLSAGRTNTRHCPSADQMAVFIELLDDQSGYLDKWIHTHPNISLALLWAGEN